jgi:hypothetical protein
LVELVFMAVIAIVAAGVGLTLLRRVGPISVSRAEELVFSIGFGLGVIALGVLALGLANLLYVEVFYGLLAAGAVIGGKELVGLVGRLQGYLNGNRINVRSFYFWLSVLIACGLLLNMLRALLPAHGAVDPLAYHLALPKLYLLRHHISFERTLTGSLYPDNIGIHWFMGVTTVVAIWCFCRRYFSSQVGIWAAAVFAFMPVFVFFSPLAYIDVGVGLFQFLGIWAFVKWAEEGERRALMLTAVFMGLAMGAKHTGIFLAVAGAFAVFGRELYKGGGLRSSFQLVALYSAIALGLAAPWYLRALWEAGNPVWPVANELFGGLAYRGSYSVSSGATEGATVDSLARAKDLLIVSATSLWEWAWNGQLGWQRATGVYYIALLPGFFVYWKVARVRWLAFACLAYYLLAVLYIDGNPRYNFALFALLSVMAGYVVEKMSQQRVRVVGWLLRAAFLITVIGNLAQGYAWALQGVNYTTSPQTPERFLIETEGNYRAFQFVDQHLPEDSMVLLQGIVKGYYCERVYMWDHPYQMLLQYGDYKTPEQLLQRMGELGITHVVRMIFVPPGRQAMYPQYFRDAFHEEFRKKFMKLIYRDESYVVFEMAYPS